MAITHNIPDGTTEPQVFSGEADGSTVDLTGATLTLEATDKDGNSVTVSGAVTWNDASISKWQYVPDGQLTKAGSPYAVRLTVDDGTNIVKFPNGRDPDTWWIRDP